MERHYTAIVGRDEARTFVYFPDAPGCSTFREEGEEKTIEELAQEALQGWVDAMVESGQELPQSHTRSMLVQVNLPEHEKKGSTPSEEE